MDSIFCKHTKKFRRFNGEGLNPHNLRSLYASVRKLSKIYTRVVFPESIIVLILLMDSHGTINRSALA